MAKYTEAEWEDRSTQFPYKRSLSIVDDVIVNGNTIIPHDTVINANVQRNEGNVTTVGTPFNAYEMNGLENRISSGFSKCLEYINFGSIDNQKINSSNGLNLSSESLECPILELFYSDNGDVYHNYNDGICSSRIFIENYNANNKISLDQISCGAGDFNDFYFKTVTLNITKKNDTVNIKRDSTRTKRLVYNASNRTFTVQTGNTVDLKIFNIIGYRFNKE